MAEYIEREAVMQKFADHVRRSNNSEFAPAPTWNQAVQIVEDFPAADVPPVPLWTDEPISGSEFMTHKRGQSGFEIHFRTDDKAKYEAVQDECRRQIGHAKPAADVRPVVLCKECRHRDPEDHKCDCGGMERQGCPFKVADDYFCAYGER